MKIIIGLVGPPLAGKETVGNQLMEIAHGDGFKANRQRFRDVLEETLDLWSIENNRPNLQKMAQIMVRDDAFGAHALANAIRCRLFKDDAQIVIADGVRWLADEKLLRSFPDKDNPNVRGVILYITADEITRYNRQKARRREGESDMSFDEFKKQGQAKTEIDIPDIGSRADWKIENNGSPEELKEKVQEFYAKVVRPMIETLDSAKCSGCAD